MPFSNCIEGVKSDFIGLYECFKTPNRFSKYYYHGDEHGLIYTDYDDKSKAVVEHEARCFERHMKNECLLVYFCPDVDEDKREKNIKNYKANQALHTFDYWSQMMGLLCLIVGASLSHLFSKLIKLAKANLSSNNEGFLYSNSTNCLSAFINARKIQRTTARRILLYLKVAILLVGVLVSLCLYTIMLLDYHNRMILNPLVKQSIENLRNTEDMHLVICIALRDFPNGSDGGSSESFYSSSKISKLADNLNTIKMNFYHNRSLLEIEKATDHGLVDSLTGLYLSFQEKAFPVEWSLKRTSVLFRHNGSELSRCYPLTVKPSEPKYMQMISISKLVIKLKVPFQLYLLAEGESFSSQSFHYSGTSSFSKKINTRLASSRKRKCVNYEQTYRDLKCTNRPSCLERCMQQRIIVNHGHIAMGFRDRPLVIDRAIFSDQEWATTLPIEEKKEAYEKAFSECEKMIPDDKKCSGVRFHRYFSLDRDAENERSFDLYYDLTKSVEEEPSWYKLALDLVNIQSVVFGFTVLSILQTISCFVQTKLKVRKNKIVTFFIYLLCAAGFVWHTSHIFDLIINGELVYSQRYEVANEMQLPEMLFCLRLDEKRLDENHKLTGNYLEQVTSDLTAEKMFKKISYLDESNRWNKFNLSQVETLFFVSSKCFSIALNLTYPRKNFRFTIRNDVLNVQFQPDFIEQVNANKRISFFTKTEGAHYYNKAIWLNFADDRRSLTVIQLLYSLRYEWKFQFLKHPSSLFFEETPINDSDGYLKRLARKFSETLDVATLNLFLKRKLFHSEIRDDLFEIFFNQEQNRSDHSLPPNLNYARDFSVYHLVKEKSPDFELIYRIFFFKKVVTTAQDGYAKLILVLLNCLSLWFDFVILDLAAYLKKMSRLFVYLYRVLLGAKRALGRWKARQMAGL